MIGANIGKFLNDVCNLVETKDNRYCRYFQSVIQRGNPYCLELKKGADVENLKNMLYKKTRLEDTFRS